MCVDCMGQVYFCSNNRDYAIGFPLSVGGSSHFLRTTLLCVLDFFGFWSVLLIAFKKALNVFHEVHKTVILCIKYILTSMFPLPIEFFPAFFLISCKF